MSDVLLKTLETVRMERNPKQYREDLEIKWKDAVDRKVYMLALGRTIEGKDNKDFQKVRKIIEKKIGRKISKDRGSLIVSEFRNEIMIGATNEEERIKRDLVFLYLKNHKERRKVSCSRWFTHREYLNEDLGNLVSERFFDILPDADCKDFVPYLSQNIRVDARIEPIGKCGEYNLHFETDKVDCLYFGSNNDWKYEGEFPYSHNGAFSWLRDRSWVWNREKECRGDVPEKNFLRDLKICLDTTEKVYADIPKININDFLSVFPEIEEGIADEVSRKLSLTKSKVVVSASYNITFTVGVESDDAEDLQKKLEKVLQQGLEGAEVPIEMSFGEDGLQLVEPELKKSLDFQFEEIA